MNKFKMIIRISLFIPIAMFLVFWIGSIIYSEILTSRYGHIFRIIIESDSWHGGHGDLGNVRVLSYTGTFARVYYTWVNPPYGIANLEAGVVLGGATLEFEKKHGEWHITRNETIWSRTGNADGFVWPYIR